MSDLSAQYQRTLEAIERLTKQLTQIKADHQREIQPLQHNLDTLWEQALTMEETLSGVKVGDVRQGTDEVFRWLKHSAYGDNFQVSVDDIGRWFRTFTVRAIKAQDDKQLICMIEGAGQSYVLLTVAMAKECEKVEPK